MFEILVDTALQLAANAVNPDAQRVELDSQLVGESLPVPDVVLPLVIAEHQVPLVLGQFGEAPAEALEEGIVGLGHGLRWRPAAALQSSALPRGLPQGLLVEEMGDATEIPVGIARPQLNPATARLTPKRNAAKPKRRSDHA